MTLHKFILAAAFLAASSTVALTQTAADPALLAEINKIQAIDNHSHPPKLVSAGEKDDDFDALPCDPISVMDPPYATRPENPDFLKAWKALWQYQFDDRTPEHVQTLLAAKQRVKQQQGDNYANWVLDRLGIQTQFANRVALGRGLQPPRFRWVPFDDALLSPLDNANLADNPDRKVFYQREEMLLHRYMRDLGVNASPASLTGYTSQVVTPELERQKQSGAVAIKFEAAYLRALDFMPATQQDAAAIYSRYIKGGAPSKPEYLTLENYLLRYIAAEAGRLNMAVHFHTGGGCGSYFDLPGSDPALLSSLIDDPALRKTVFVFVHGGAQTFSKKVSYLLSKPNAYTDMSEQTALISPRALSIVLREWLEWYPEKVLFGTDLAPGPPELDWEEVGWVEANTGRQALALALTGMMQDGQISREQATQIAHMVMHDNAAKLYGLK
jgi:predicted TIM-barrel fold metal-dependent hydrolase